MSSSNVNSSMTYSTAASDVEASKDLSLETHSISDQNDTPIHQSAQGDIVAKSQSNLTDGNEYVADETNRRDSKQKLDAEYSEILEEVNKVVERNSTSRFTFIMHLLKMVLFWRVAKKDPAYLQELYQQGIQQKEGDETKKSPKVFKLDVNHGINFAPMINAVWKNHPACDLVSKKTNRVSRAMNNIHVNYLEDKMYTEEDLKKVVAEIIKDGGMNKLVKYGKQDADPGSDGNAVPDSSSDKLLCKKVGSMTPAENEKLFQESLLHYDNVIALPTAKLTKDIAVDDDNLSMVLLRKNKLGEFKMVGQVNSKSQIEKALA